MAKKLVFTDESLATLVDEVKSYTDEAVSTKANSSHEHSASKITSGTLAIKRGGTGNMWGYVQAGAEDGTSIGALATAEGRNVTASGDYCHAEGNYTEASGSSSHAEGQSTEASGNFSHAEGEGSIASGKSSHAEGQSTIAKGDYSHAQGKYNIEDTAGNYAHIVGNGTSNSARSNAHTLDWDGNAWFAGNVYVGGSGQNDTNASKVLTKAEIDSTLSISGKAADAKAVGDAIANIEIDAGSIDIDLTGSNLGEANPVNADTLGGHPIEDFINPKAGFIYPLASTIVPKGFLLCDGAEYLRDDYPELFAAISTTYGAGDGSTTFNVPNLQTRVPVGAGGEYAIGDVGGEAEHTLTVDEMPSHTHKIKYNANTNTTNITGACMGNGTIYGGADTYDAGGNQPHNNMQPYTVVNYIIATGKNSGVSVSDVILGVQALPLGIEYGGTGATTAEIARQNLGITAENLGITTIELLWENASPESEFAPQTITLDLSGLDFIFVTTTTSNAAIGSGNYQSTVFVPARVGESGAISSFGMSGSEIWGHTRYVWVRSNGIEFGAGNQFQVGGGIYANWNNRAVPTAIYGIKGVSA